MHPYVPSRLTALILIALLSSCGGDRLPDTTPDPDPIPSPPPVNGPVAMPDMRVTAGDWVALEAEAGAPLSWRQLAGSAQTLQPAAFGAATGFAAPAVTSTTELLFEVSSAGLHDTAAVVVEPCEAVAGVWFGDCLRAPGYAYEAGEARGEIFHAANTGDFHVQWQRRAATESGRGQVLAVTWNANDPGRSRDVNGWFGLAPTTPLDWRGLTRAALQFDLRVVEHEDRSGAAPFIFKMECGFPCSSAELPLVDATVDDQWRTFTFTLAELEATGLELGNITHPLIVQPAWRDQEARVTVEIDNVRLLENYLPAPNGDCPAAGSVRYTLAREPNPNADQQEAYRLITAAMDEAVATYNCYTNLSRTLQVSYNTGVATADGSTNGSIRFGSRASMHPVTAMHEIGHVFGVGSNPYRALVRDRVFTGAQATAMVRRLSGDPAALVNTDGTHFWPYGLNYISEGQALADRIAHCQMVSAIAADL